MPIISTCPRCHQAVTVPTDLDLAVLVRCPLCNAEYPLSEAFPPALIPVVAAVSKPEVTEEAADEEQETEDNIAIPISSGDRIIAEAEEVISAEEQLHDLEDHYEVEDEVAETGEEQPEKLTEESEEVEENEAVAVVGRVPAPAPRRRRAPKSALQTLIEVVTGGVAGCLVAYYGLAAYYGPEFKSVGLPKIALPGIAWLTSEPVAAEAEQSQPATNKPAEPKPTPNLQPAETPQPQAAAEPSSQPAEPAAQNTGKNEAIVEQPAPAAEPVWLRPKPGMADYIGPRIPPIVTADQLDSAVKAAVGVDLSADELSPEDYATFCRLGEALAFVNGDTSNEKLTESIATAKELLKQIAKRPELFDMIGKAANERLEAKDQNMGVLLAGTVKNPGRQGKLSGAMVQLAGQSKSISVLSDIEFTAEAERQAIVLGVLVREPVANLVGYTGSKPVVVWAAALIPAP